MDGILYEDKAVIVCRKPAGFPTQTARIGEPDMESALKNYLKSPYVGIIHRLDQPELRRRLIHQIDGLIRQIAVVNVAVG